MFTSRSNSSLPRLFSAACILFACLLTTNRAFALDPVETTNNLAPSRPPTVAVDGERPLWELGIGVGGVYSQDYPGSNQGKFWVLPIPFAVYRGQVFKSDKEGGTRACWLHGQTWEFNISGAGSFPSSSSTGARQGMPDMEWLGEVGPAFSLRLFQTENKTQLRFNIPLRASGSTNLEHVAWRGFMLAPNLVFDLPLGPKQFNFFSSLGADFADRARMGYYYDVDQQYVTSTRGYYHAKAGFLRATLSTGLSYEIPRWDMSLYAILSHDSYAGATNEGSPLMQQTQSWSGGLALTWRFASSKTRVKSN